MNVVIVGGGLAGLGSAAYIKEQLPEVTVTLLEAEARTGGRAHSMPFGGEGGCSLPFFYHGPTIELCQAQGINIQNYQGSKINLGFSVLGQSLMNAAQWATSDVNPMEGKLAQVPPFMLFHCLGGQSSRPSEWAKALSDKDPHYLKSFATQTTADFLKQRKIPDSLIPLAESSFHVFEDPSEISALSSLLRVWVASPSGEFYFFDGTYQRLVDKLECSIDHLHLSTAVKSVTKDTESQTYIVTDNNGNIHRADQVVIATSAQALKSINMASMLSNRFEQAVQAIKYSPVIKLFFRAKTRFWENDDDPTTMLSDEVFNTCFPVFDPETRQTPFSGPDIWGFEVCLIGAMARRAMEQGIDDLPQRVQEHIEKLRPAAKDCLEFETLLEWNNNSIAGGALCYFQPDENVPDYFGALRSSQQGLLFAGEYTEYQYQGYDAAIASAKRVAQTVVKNLSLACA